MYLRCSDDLLFCLINHMCGLVMSLPDFKPKDYCFES